MWVYMFDNSTVCCGAMRFCLIVTDCSNAVNTVKRTAVLTAGATWVPALTPFVAKCATRGRHRTGVALHALLTLLKRAREEFESKCVEAFAYLDDVIIGMVEDTSDTMDIMPSLQRELASISIFMNPSKTMALPSKGHVPTLEEIALLKSVDVRIAERGGVKVVGVPIGTDAYVMGSMMEIVQNGGAERLAWMLPHMPNKQSANPEPT